MPNMFVPTATDIAVQNSTTGAIDYLQFTGTTLTASSYHDFGIPGWNVVAHGDFNLDNHQDLVVQNAAGQVDFLDLDAKGNLIGSALSPVSLPPIVGGGFFDDNVAGQTGNTLVAQLANCQLDMLGFNPSGKLLHSDLIANTVGLPHAVGVADSFLDFPAYANIGTGGNDNVELQLPDGSLDSIGFSGDFRLATLSLSASQLVSGSAGLPTVGAVNQEAGFLDFFDTDYNVVGPPGAGGVDLEGTQYISQLANGTFDALYADSGYGDPTHQGALYASEQLNLSMPGWHAVDAGAVTREIFPLT
jgi:hypothetical protein